MTSWPRIVWLALCYEVDQNMRAIAGGIGGLLLLVAIVLIEIGRAHV